jgi:hypothetical protein
VSTNETLNLASLKMVQDELVATIEQAAMRLEQFTNDRANGELLQDCIDGVKQIRGTLSLIQLKGVDLLADELVEHITDITLDAAPKNDRKLELLTSAFFILPRYLEYCTQTSRSMAMLLIPYINELRLARKAQPLPESYYYAVEPTQILHTPRSAPLAPNETITTVARRLRHMYQTGLLKVLQGAQVKPSLGIMMRALERMEGISGTNPISTLWWLAGAVLFEISEQGLQLTKSRKMLFSAIDREIKRVQFEGDVALKRPLDKTMAKELLYLVAIARTNSEKAQSVLKTFNVKPLGYTEAELMREMEFLKGPSANTLNSMAAVLSDELRSTKNILERAAQGGPELLNESPELLDTLKKVAEILAVVGLVSPSNSLKQEIERIAGWQETKAQISPDELLGVADTLLYVESSISGLGKINLSDEKLAQINALSRDAVMANSQIAEAEKLVIEEAESGLAMVKRALSAFMESNYDKGHIKNIVGTLDSVRGGMFVLGLPRAAKVVAGCLQFIDESLLQNEQQAAVQHMLETFADAIISLEYYLDSIKIDKGADTSVLQIAEESLEALGYKV